jgi:hypothetical protein
MMKTWLTSLLFTSFIVAAIATAPIADSDVTRVTGQLTHIEGWHYTIKDSRGEEVSFGVTQATQDPDKVQEGDYIVAMVGEDRIARTIKNMKKKS